MRFFVGRSLLLWIVCPTEGLLMILGFLGYLLWINLQSATFGTCSKVLYIYILFNIVYIFNNCVGKHLKQG